MSLVYSLAFFIVVSFFASFLSNDDLFSVSMRDCGSHRSVLVKLDKVRYLVKRHGFGNELDIDLFALLEHAF